MADTNIALNRTTSASSYVMPYASSRAVNGNLQPTSRWLCNTVPANMTVDLGATYVISAWTVRHMGAAGWRAPDYNMCDYMLQGSNNNSSWVTIDSVVNNLETIASRSVTCAYRYVKLNVTKGLRTNPQYASLMELEIYGHAPDASLSALSISSGALTPAFAPATLEYTAPKVPYGTTSVVVYAAAADPTSAIKVNDAEMTGGQSTVNLKAGINTINVLVTALDGVTAKTYTITVEREQGAVLSNLTISSGTLNPTFSSSNLNYTTQSVGYDTTSVTVTPTTNISGCTITVSGNTATSGQPSTVKLDNVGSNTINIVVTNGAASQTYTIAVVRASSPYLQSVTGFQNLDPAFTQTNLGVYTATVSNNTTSTKITPMAVDSNAQITVNGTVVVSGQKSQNIPIVVGNNSVQIIVTSASGGDQRIYNFIIVRTS
ncbi:F5/8 type C domain-containing protein [Ruminiclostridium sufflavum DSM 19573]|uniref:F5/8 type C domain-containing protein n=1 Tax=Ruminiclostridium sufflavum DSM 19573 TaxID=1121337 RepID=A0A318XQG7_9FIRM|nr:cadherin-like beta sandwich domain-containing protein [Ruminiclostridium sufflavum]PYG90335.1 F5/8 type C domain-containing protein [Ruminiclostridium sufflavum DSM 19573]